MLVLDIPQEPPNIVQHAIVWIMNEWNDPKSRRSMRRECDDLMLPYAPHPGCDRISGTYREGEWFVFVSAQAINLHQPPHTIVGIPVYEPPE
jgi:hypothetical protein